VARFCANCGTEVDESAIFCPTCGQPIDEAAESQMPPAPAWPDPEPDGAAEASEPVASGVPPAQRDAAGSATLSTDDATRVEPRAEPPPPPVTPAPARTVPPAADTRRGGAGPAMNLPITTPVTLSAWLIGIGAVMAALGVLVGLFDGILNPIELILLIALIAIAASVFFSANLPDIPNARLITLVIVLIGFGIALDRLSLGAAGVGELLLFLGAAAAAIGVILLELGRDQPLGRAGG
jgi:hypothetical protein